MPRLKRVTRDDLIIERRRRGRAHAYYEASGQRITDPAVLARIRALGIPPAWRGVRIAAEPRAHIQAFGEDDAGRGQYIYHPDWEARRSRRKERQLALLTTVLPRIRRQVRSDLEAEAGSKTLALAIGVALIDRTAMRVGREKYLAAHGTRGAGTLYARDVTVKGDTLQLRFPAKSGKRASYVVNDARLAAAITRILALRGRRLLLYRDDDDGLRPLRTPEINAYLRRISGVSVSAKDFRTLHGSALAAEALAGLAPHDSPTGRRRQAAGVTRKVAAFLQNTPVICRKSYIAPCLFMLFDNGRLQELWMQGGNGKSGLKQREMRLGAILAGRG